MFKSSKSEMASLDYQEAEDEIMQGKKEYHRQLEVPFSISFLFLSIYISETCTRVYGTYPGSIPSISALKKSNAFSDIVSFVGFSAMQFSGRSTIFMSLGLMFLHLSRVLWS